MGRGRVEPDRGEQAEEGRVARRVRGAVGELSGLQVPVGVGEEVAVAEELALHVVVGGVARQAEAGARAGERGVAGGTHGEHQDPADGQCHRRDAAQRPGEGFGPRPRVRPESLG